MNGTNDGGGPSGNVEDGMINGGGRLGTYGRSGSCILASRNEGLKGGAWVEP